MNSRRNNLEYGCVDAINYDNSRSNLYIYHILFNNNTGYIGSTLNPRRRLIEHIKTMKVGTHSNPIVQNTYNKHGLKSINILHRFNPDYRDKIEEWFINKSQFDSTCNIQLNVEIVPAFRKGSLSDKDIDNLFRDAVSGLNLKELSSKYNISTGSVRDILSGKTYFNVKTQYRKLYLDNKEHIIKKIRIRSQSTRRVHVYQFDLDGNFIQDFSSIEEAGKKLNISPYSISVSIRKNLRYGKFQFSKIKEPFYKDRRKLVQADIDKIFELAFIPLPQRKIAKQLNCEKTLIKLILQGEAYADMSKKHLSKYLANKDSLQHITQSRGCSGNPIHVYIENGEFVKTFYNIPECASYLNLNKNSVQSACKKGTAHKGFVFRRGIKDFGEIAKKEKVYLHDSTQKLIREYDTVKQCQIEFNMSNTLFYNYVNTGKFCQKIGAYITKNIPN